MQWFHNLKTGTKIVGLILIIALFMGVVGFTGYYYADKLSDGMNAMYKDYLLPVKWINAASSQSRAVEALTMELFQPGVSKEQEQKVLEEAKQRIGEVDTLLGSYSQAKLDPFEQEQLPILQGELKVYRSERQKAVDMALAGDKQGAYAYFTTSAAPHVDKVNNILNQLTDFNAQRAEEINEAGKKDAASVGIIIVVITIFCLALSILAGVGVSRMITKRLDRVVAALKQVAQGDLSQKLAVTAQDEIGELGHALNATADHLRKLVQRIAGAAQNVTAASEELTASTDQSAQAAEQITTGITEVSSGAEKEMAAIDGASASVQQMSAGIQQIAANANSVAAVAEDTVQSAKKGGEAVDSAVAQMSNIDATVAKTASMVAKLGERSKEIGQIVDTIAGIAGQTNLLALNAAIEAARAGEQGRGFAVVAEEVRKLAEQSQDAAKEIAALIQSIQSETDSAVEAMNQGTHEVQVGSGVVANAGQSFKDIVALINKVSADVQEISAAIEQMAGGSQQVVSSIEEIDKASKHISGQTQSVSAATEEQSASMQEVAASAQSLAKMAEDLQQATTIFKV
ncbi:MAG: methyl-accepting chemotaxis protein [Veillonellales bacterium]